MNRRFYYAFSAQDTRPEDQRGKRGITFDDSLENPVHAQGVINEIDSEGRYKKIVTFFGEQEEEVLNEELSKFVSELKQEYLTEEIVPMGYWLQDSEPESLFM